MNFEIPTGTLTGSVDAPPSKSMTHRLLIIGALSGKKTIFQKPLFCDDTRVTMEGLRKMGFEIESTRDSILFKGIRNDIKKPIKISVDNSGTSARLLAAVAALLPVRCTVSGSRRMQQRPMLPLISALQTIGAKIEHRSGYVPMKISGGNLSGGKITVDSMQSSQFLSAILLIAPCLPENSQIYFGNSVASKPYVDMTAALMKRAGITIEESTDHYSITSRQPYIAADAFIEGDFSNAANFMIGAAITGGRVEIKNLSTDSIQGDKFILKILKASGAKVDLLNSRIIVEGGGEISAMDWDMRNCPDLVPIVSVLALFAKGISTLRCVDNLRLKESNRLKAIVENINRMNGTAYITGDDLIIEPQQLKGNSLPAYNDHRIAMSFAMVGLKVPSVVIEDSNCVRKSYPRFWDDFKQLVQ